MKFTKENRKRVPARGKAKNPAGNLLTIDNQQFLDSFIRCAFGKDTGKPVPAMLIQLLNRTHPPKKAAAVKQVVAAGIGNPTDKAQRIMKSALDGNISADTALGLINMIKKQSEIDQKSSIACRVEALEKSLGLVRPV